MSTEAAAHAFREADALRRMGRPSEAIPVFESVLRRCPLGEGWMGLGLARSQAGDAAGALEAFDAAALAFEAEGLPLLRGQALGNRAAALHGVGRIGEAVLAYQAAIGAIGAAGGTVDPFLRANLATAQAGAGDLDGALATCDLAFEGTSGHAAAHLLRVAGSTLRAAGRNEEAARVLEAAIPHYEAASLPIEAARTRIMVAGLAWAARDANKAIPALEAAIAVMRGHLALADLASLLVDLGALLYEQRDHVRALVALDEAALLAPEASGPLQGRLRGNRGLALVVAGRFEEASADLSLAVQLARGSGDRQAEARHLATLSNLARYQGDLSGAVELQRQVMELEQAHGFRVEEPGGLLYSAIEDRSLNVFQAVEGREAVAQGGRVLPPADLGARPGPAMAASAQGGLRPVLMIAPPLYGTFGPIFPRGATSIATWLSHHGIPSLVLPLAHYVDDFGGATAARARLREVVQEALEALRPRAVGLSATFSFIYPRTLEIARIVREVAPELPILIGGPHVTYQDEVCLREAPEIDMVVRGEGEWTALETLRTLESGGDLSLVKGLTWRGPDGTIHRNPNRPLGDVRELPDLDFRLLPEAFCRVMEISALTSRGCTFRCKYCHEFRYWGGVVREHDPQRIVRELETMGRDYGNALQGIDDSMLDMTSPYFFDLVAQVGRSPWLPERFGFLTRLDTITADGLAAMTAVGIRSLSVGAESGSQKVLDAMNKGLKVEQTSEALALARDAGVRAAAFFIVGHPGDDRQEHEKTLSLVEHLFREDMAVWTDLSIFTPYPGTPFYSMPQRYGVEILSRDWSLWRRSNRPIAQLQGYAAGEIYLDYLRTLELQGRLIDPAQRSSAGVRPGEGR